MKVSIFFAASAFMLALPAFAQEYAKAEVFGGYSNFHTSILGQDFHSNGAVGSIAFNPKPWLGAVGEVGLYHSSLDRPSGSSTDETFLFGPKVTVRANRRLTPFGQALFGGMHLGNAQFGAEGVSKTAFAMAFGGGLDVNLNKTVAVRLFQLDWLRTHFHGNSTLDNWQNAPRFSVGLVLSTSMGGPSH